MHTPLRDWFSRWQCSLLQQLGERALASGPRRAALERRLPLQLEQLWKIETQLLLPALQALQPQSLSPAAQEVEALRDVALLLERSEAPNRELCWAVMQRLAQLHFARVDELLLQPGAARLDAAALLAEAQDWLAQWAGGDIEDEDRDPVGQPPR